MPADPFQPIRRATSLFSENPLPWFVAGGWAIDLFLARVTRPHSDIEISVYRRDQIKLRQLFTKRTPPETWRLEKAISTETGGTWVDWPAGEHTVLPIHQIRATCAASPPWELEFFLNECDETHWLSRRHKGLRRPLADVAILSSAGIPICPPKSSFCSKPSTPAPRTSRISPQPCRILTPRKKRGCAKTCSTTIPAIHGLKPSDIDLPENGSQWLNRYHSVLQRRAKELAGWTGQQSQATSGATPAATTCAASQATATAPSAPLQSRRLPR
jgi:hypothetical protein